MIHLLNYSWIIFIVLIVVNAFLFKNSTKKYVISDPILEEGYNKVFKAMIIYGSLPFIIIGFGIISGFAKSIFDFLNPRNNNPFVLAFYALLVVYWVLLIRWIYFKNGAEFLEKHKGIIVIRVLNQVNDSVSAKQIKTYLPFILVLHIVMIIITTCFVNFNLPKFE